MIKFDMIGYCNMHDRNYNVSNEDINLSEMLSNIINNKKYYKTHYHGGVTTKLITGDNYLSIIVQNDNGTDISFESILACLIWLLALVKF